MFLMVLSALKVLTMEIYKLLKEKL